MIACHGNCHIKKVLEITRLYIYSPTKAFTSPKMVTFFCYVCIRADGNCHIKKVLEITRLYIYSPTKAFTSPKMVTFFCYVCIRAGFVVIFIGMK